MTHRLTTIAAIAVTFLAGAQSASAAISNGERPLAQEMDHGVVAPASEGGVSSSPGAVGEASDAEPEVAQGISTSPGASEPVVESQDVPVYEANQDESEDQPATPDECAELDRQINSSLALAGMFEAFAGALESAGADSGEMRSHANDWAENASILTDMEYEGGCHSGSAE